jgi:hypothetical protein
MKGVQELARFAQSPLPDRMDDAAFCGEMELLETEQDVAAFAKDFGLARSMVEGWKKGRFVPQPELRRDYCEWLRRHAREQLAHRLATGVNPVPPLSAAQLAALARGESQAR